jgi:hypothetical protein
MKEKTMARPDYEIMRMLLKPPLRVIGITPGTDRPAKPQYNEHFGSLEDVYAFFRKKRPEGRWLIWVKDADGQGIALR